MSPMRKYKMGKIYKKLIPNGWILGFQWKLNMIRNYFKLFDHRIDQILPKLWTLL